MQENLRTYYEKITRSYIEEIQKQLISTQVFEAFIQRTDLSWSKDIAREGLLIPQGNQDAVDNFGLSHDQQSIEQPPPWLHHRAYRRL